MTVLQFQVDGECLRRGKTASQMHLTKRGEAGHGIQSGQHHLTSWCQNCSHSTAPYKDARAKVWHAINRRPQHQPGLQLLKVQAAYSTTLPSSFTVDLGAGLAAAGLLLGGRCPADRRRAAPRRTQAAAGAVLGMPHGCRAPTACQKQFALLRQHAKQQGQPKGAHCAGAITARSGARPLACGFLIHGSSVSASSRSAHVSSSSGARPTWICSSGTPDSRSCAQGAGSRAIKSEGDEKAKPLEEARQRVMQCISQSAARMKSMKDVRATPSMLTAAINACSGVSCGGSSPALPRGACAAGRPALAMRLQRSCRPQGT
jgi:hypothetical protein